MLLYPLLWSISASNLDERITKTQNNNTVISIHCLFHFHNDRFYIRFQDHSIRKMGCVYWLECRLASKTKLEHQNYFNLITAAFKKTLIIMTVEYFINISFNIQSDAYIIVPFEKARSSIYIDHYAKNNRKPNITLIMVELIAARRKSTTCRVAWWLWCRMWVLAVSGSSSSINYV